MSGAPSSGWQIFFWTCFVWNIFLIPLGFCHLYSYIKHRDNAFFRPRMSNATIIMILSILLCLLERIYDGFVGIGYINDNIVNSVITYVQMYPTFALYIYKYVDKMLTSIPHTYIINNKRSKNTNTDTK